MAIKCHVFGTCFSDSVSSFVINMRHVPREGETIIINGNKPCLVERVTWVVKTDAQIPPTKGKTRRKNDTQRSKTGIDMVSIYVTPHPSTASFSGDVRHEALMMAWNDGAKAERDAIIANLKRAAAGRHEYASGVKNDDEVRKLLINAADGLDDAVSLIEDPSLMLDIIPSWRWSAEETTRITKEQDTLKETR